MLTLDENSPDALAMPWYEVWMDVVTYPSRDTFRRILADPSASQVRAYLWMAILGAIVGIIQMIFIQAFFSKLANLPSGSFSQLMICSLVGSPILFVVGLGLMAAILHGFARMFKGKGSFNDMVYCLGAIQAPLMIVSYLLSLIAFVFMAGSFTSLNQLESTNFSSLVVPNLIFTLLSLVFSIYTIVLQVLALDAVQKFGIGKAILTALAPYAVSILLSFCLVFALPMIIFSTR